MAKLTLLLAFVFILIQTGKSHHKRQASVVESKIVGGRDVSISQYPYMVYMQVTVLDDILQCGGTIISDKFVLTAAHCIKDSPVSVSLLVGSTKSTGKFQAASSYHTHPNYNESAVDYDVGLVEFKTAITIDGKTTKVVQLAEEGSSVTEGTVVTILGWGSTVAGGTVSSTLKAVEVPVVNLATCQKAYREANPPLDVYDTAFCAGQGGKDACDGDSGGPAVTNGVQVGVISEGNGCADQQYPGIYSLVGPARSWIKSVAGV